MRAYHIKFLLPIAFSIFNCQFANAQLYIDGDVLLVQKNATLYIEGDLETAKSGSVNPKVANWGTLAVEGEVDFHSSTVYNGQGDLCFTGSATQTISASFPLKKIDIQNNANVELSGDFNLQGELKLTSGHLVIGNYDLTIDDSVSITGGSSSSYIRINGTGKVITEVGSSPVTLPIGRNPYLPIIIDDGGGKEYSVAVADKVYANPETETTEQTTNVVSETWTIQSSGAQTGVSVTLQWVGDEEESGFARSASFLSFWENGVSTIWNTGTSASASGSGPYTRTRTIDFTTNLFYFGVGSSGSALPVELTYFNVKWIASAFLGNHDSTSLSNHANSATESATERSRSGSRSGDAHIIWQTALEENNSHFEIQRSFDGNTYEKIGTVEGQGNTMQTTDYQFIDNGLESKVQSLRSNGSEFVTVYYRLKQVDYDGQYEYSETRSLNCSPEQFGIELGTLNSFTIWPNPNSGTELNLSETGNYQVYNTHGVLIESYMQVQKIDISNLVKGTYIIQDEMGAHQVLIRQ